ncbi:MAG: response regulator [Bacteroidetes bacterium]|nr:response regulator [Bacteroidota bacterium]
MSNPETLSNLNSAPVEVLVVDDDSITIFLAKKTITLSHPDYQVNSFLDGRKAIEYLGIRSTELSLIILLDINMPEYSGWDFLEDYEKRGFGFKVFMFTSSIDPFDLAKSKSYPSVKGFISKPLNREKLEEIFKGL